MKHVLSYLLGIVLLLATNLYADIDSKIEAIQNAPVEERFKLMNAFKKELLHMQEQERVRAIGKLKSITNSQHTQKAIREIRQVSTTRPGGTNQHSKKSKRDHHPYRDELIRNRTDHHMRESSEDEIENEANYEVENEMEDQVEEEAEDQVENEIEDQVEEEAEDQVENEIEDQVEEEAEDQVENEIEDQVEQEAEDQVENEIEDQVEEEAEDHIEDEIEDNMEDSHDDDD